MPAIIHSAGRVVIYDEGRFYVQSDTPGFGVDALDPSTMRTAADAVPADGDTVVSIRTGKIDSVTVPAAFTGPVYRGGAHPYLQIPETPATALSIPGGGGGPTLYEKTVYVVCRPERDVGLNALYGRVQSTGGARAVIGVGTRLQVLYGAGAEPLVHGACLTVGVDTVVAVQISRQSGVVGVANGVAHTLLADLGGAYGDAAAQTGLDLALFQSGDGGGAVSAGPGDGFVGRLYEVAVYNGVHSVPEMQRQIGLLEEKWGLGELGLVVDLPRGGDVAVFWDEDESNFGLTAIS